MIDDTQAYPSAANNYFGDLSDCRRRIASYLHDVTRIDGKTWAS